MNISGTSREMGKRTQRIASALGTLAAIGLASFAAAPSLAHNLQQPADPQANSRTQNALTYLALVPERKTKRMLYGQYAASEACCSADEIGERGFSLNLSQAEQHSGRTPAIIGVDYNEWDSARKTLVGNFQALNALVLPYTQRGSLVTIGYHAANPWTGGYWSSGGCPGSFGDLVDPAKPVSAAWRRQLATVADGMAQLQKAGAVVLWRPFLEMNGASNWWWQQCRPTPAAFRAVWKDMFDYLTHERGLHNLLWVYAPLTQTGSNRPALELYPGNDVVDIAGYDDYHDYAEWPDYDRWRALGKVLAYTERGPHETDGTSTVYADLLDGVDKHGWKISYFQAWGGPFHPINNPNGLAMITDERIAGQTDVAAAIACMAKADSSGARRACVLK